MEIDKITNLINDKLYGWSEALIKLPNIVLAAVVMVIGLYIAKFIRKIMSWLIRFLKTSRLTTFVTIVYFSFIGIVLFTVLTILNLDKAVTSILAGAGILGLALAFAFKTLRLLYVRYLISFRNR
jgi:small-conductance mechanosensitive channel